MAPYIFVKSMLTKSNIPDMALHVVCFADATKHSTINHKQTNKRKKRKSCEITIVLRVVSKSSLSIFLVGLDLGQMFGKYDIIVYWSI